MPKIVLSDKPDFLDVKGILFDVDGTLYHQPPLRLIMILLLTISHFHKPRELFRKLKVIYHYRQSQEVLRNRNDMVDDNQQNQIALTAKGSKEPLQYISNVVKEWLETRPLRFIHLCRRRGMKETISKLHQEGFKLGVFSDYPPREKLSALRIVHFFSTVVSSHDHDVNGFKPNTNGFAVAARKMNLYPGEILYIGDRHEVDGIGATQAGMKVAIIDHNFKSVITHLLFTTQTACKNRR